MKTINFKYEETKEGEKDKKNIIIKEESFKEDIKLDLETESLDEISKLNNFILEQIAANEEITFIGIEETYAKNEIIKNIIESIIIIYQKEYQEVLDASRNITEQLSLDKSNE